MNDHIPDVTKMIGDTPRTDAAIWNSQDRSWMDGTLCRQLERELNAANERIKNLESALSTVENIDKVNAYQDLESANERIKRLEEALAAYQKAYTPDGHIKPHDCFATGPRTGDPIQDLVVCPGCWAEQKAKEAKP